MTDFWKKCIVVAGHYGSGKTNLAINLALWLAQPEGARLPGLSDRREAEGKRPQSVRESGVQPSGAAATPRADSAAELRTAGVLEYSRAEEIDTDSPAGERPTCKREAERTGPGGSRGETGCGTGDGQKKRAVSGQADRVALIDLDIVNPYFRATDAEGVLRAAGVEVIAPLYAGTNLDLPALPAEIGRVFTDQFAGRAIFDVGGDDAGAIALGQYTQGFERAGYTFLFCVNFRRMETRTAADALALLREIETAGRLRATAIVNNTNLGAETTPQLVRESLPQAEELSRLAGLPVAAVTALPEVCEELWEIGRVLPLRMYTKSYF